MLPSVVSLTPQIEGPRAHRKSLVKPTGLRQQQRQQPDLQEYASDGRRAQIPSDEYSRSPAAASSLPLQGNSTGLSAFTDPQLLGMRSRHYAVRPSIRSSRWSPYATAPRNVATAIPWNDVENAETQNHRRRRTSPRRRLAASKARARALQLSMEGEQSVCLGRFEGDPTTVRSPGCYHIASSRQQLAILA
ncbi:hypothetical protein PI125_g17555 [Phytophthora idaei]|nr:hypothetical protein PI125_g17555 [Phytophthora idaei]KAG3141158.1 hypothetical protein PI126_g15626 [Phytophthora idaei]